MAVFVPQRSQRGNILELTGQENLSFPSLLTTDPDLRWAHSGRVDVVTNDMEVDIKETVGSGIALCGNKWIGCLRLIDNVFSLDAYSHGGLNLEQPTVGYCPDWDESLTDKDALLFTITVP